MTIDREQAERNLARYGPFAATERVLMALVRAGADRQEAHEWLREMSLQAWAAIRQDEPNPLADLLAANERIGGYLSTDALHDLMNVKAYTGTAAARATAMTAFITSELKNL